MGVQIRKRGPTKIPKNNKQGELLFGTGEEVKLTKKIWGPNEPKSGPKLVFFAFSQVWSISFPLNCIG